MFEDQNIYCLTYDIKILKIRFGKVIIKNELKFIAGRVAYLRMVHFAS